MRPSCSGEMWIWRTNPKTMIASAWGSARSAEASVTLAAHDLEVGVFEAGGVGLHHGERRLDGTQDRMNAVTVELDLEGWPAARPIAEARELVAKTGTVRSVDEDVILD